MLPIAAFISALFRNGIPEKLSKLFTAYALVTDELLDDEIFPVHFSKPPAYFFLFHTNNTGSIGMLLFIVLYFFHNWSYRP
jgi:hypothetical protein